MAFSNHQSPMLGHIHATNQEVAELDQFKAQYKHNMLHDLSLTRTTMCNMDCYYGSTNYRYPPNHLYHCPNFIPLRLADILAYAEQRLGSISNYFGLTFIETSSKLYHNANILSRKIVQCCFSWLTTTSAFSNEILGWCAHGSYHWFTYVSRLHHDFSC